MTKIKREDLEGIINVQDGEVTPITRRKIENVDASDWSTLSVAELSDQMATLQLRLAYAQMHSPGMILPIQRGMAQLDLLIKNKQGEGTGLI